MLATVLVSTLVLARAWTRPAQLALPLGFAGFLLSNIPLFTGVREGGAWVAARLSTSKHG